MLVSYAPAGDDRGDRLSVAMTGADLPVGGAEVLGDVDLHATQDIGSDLYKQGLMRWSACATSRPVPWATTATWMVG